MAPPPLAFPRRSCHVERDAQVAATRCPSAYVARDAQGALARCAWQSEDASQIDVLALQKDRVHSAAAVCCNSRKQEGNAIGACGLRLQVERAITRSALLLLHAVLVHCIVLPVVLSLLQACFLDSFGSSLLPLPLWFLLLVTSW